MSSSTSNSERELPAVAPAARSDHTRRAPSAGVRAELKALLVTLTVVLLAELWVRFTPPRSIGDRAMLRSFEAKAATLVADKGVRAVLLGNSLTRNGYDMAAFEAELATHPPAVPFHAVNAALFGSSLTEWYHIFAREFAAVDVAVINLSPGAAQDELPQNLRVAWLPEESLRRDLPRIVRQDVYNVEQAGEFLQSCANMVFAYRSDLRYDILSRWVPKYWDGVEWVNHGLLEAANKQKKATVAPPPVTYNKLSRFADLAKSRGVRLVLVAMPVQDSYEMDQALMELIRRRGLGFMDCRKVPGLLPTHFKDGWHLNAEGGVLFSRYMARELPVFLGAAGK